MCISQENWKNSYKPLTDKDTVDVVVKYRYIVATRMLYKDWYGLKKIENQQLYTIQSQDRQINSLLSAVKKYEENDSINMVRLKNDSILIKDLDVKFKKNRNAKIISSVSVPVVAVLGFLFGWLLNK